MIKYPLTAKADSLSLHSLDTPSQWTNDVVSTAIRRLYDVV